MRRRARALRALSTVLILAGAFLLADAGVTLLWQEPLSALYARIHQDRLAGQLEQLQSLNDLQARALARLRSERRRRSFLARALQRRVGLGDALGRIRVKRLGIDFVMVQGTDPGDLREGPGHYPGTPLPGLRGTVAVAGHRTTYLAPFRGLNEMRPGDLIVLTMPYGRYTYRTEKQQIVSPNAYDYVTATKPYDRLALTACHPLYSAAKRIVVFARLLSVQSLGRARLPV
jgi:sortase A